MIDCGPCDSVEEGRMKRSRFSEEQVLREAEAGVPVADLCRKLAPGVGICRAVPQ